MQQKRGAKRRPGARIRRFGLTADKTGHPVARTANKRRICAGNSVLSTDIRIISVQRGAFSAYRCRDTAEVGARRHLRDPLSLFLVPPPSSALLLPSPCSFRPFSLLPASLGPARSCTTASLVHLAGLPALRNREENSPNARV
jgi:hypothetical protein